MKPEKSIKRSLDHIAARPYESEKAIEAYLARRIAAAGGLCLKYSNTQQTGYPDRLILLPEGRAAFCELKSRGAKPTPAQAYRIEALRRLGYPVAVCDSRGAVDAFVDSLISELL